MKRIILLSLILSIAPILADSQVTYLSDTAFTTDVGFGGAPASCRYEPHGYWYGLDMTNTHGWSVADFITIPSGQEWAFDTVIIFGYQIGGTITSPLLARTCRFTMMALRG